MYHLSNGASVTNDTGTQAVIAALTSDLSLVSSGGCTVDARLDIFCGQDLSAPNPVYDGMEYTNWNGGVLPSISTGIADALGATNDQVAWGYGCGVDLTCSSSTFESVQDVVINSRTNPSLVAFPLAAGMNNGIVTYYTNLTVIGTTTNGGVVTTNYLTNITSTGSGGGIRVLNATTGSASFANGIYTQSLTNIDWNQAYTCAAWDNVGNLYGASSTRNVWRVWSPPGPSANTTLALAQVVIVTPVLPPPTPPNITGVTASTTGPGCATVTITFTGPSVLPASESFNVVASATLNGGFTVVSDAVITSVGSGTYQATFSNCLTAFYQIVLAVP
jgi:hypothetical protein